MKTSRGCVLSASRCLLLVSCWIAAPPLVLAAQDDSPFSIVERGPHSRTWQRTTMDTLPDGRTIEHKASYVELATGMHYLKDGQWTESKEEIELIDGVAVARQGQFRVGFAANLNSAGAIEMVAPDGKRFRSHVLGLAYTDYDTGNSVLIAEARDTIGAVQPPNRVLYRNAFSGDCAADVRYTCTVAGFEQDIILLTAPPSPSVWGLNPETTRLEVFTEFIEAPEAVITPIVLRQETDPEARQWMKEPDLIDHLLDFGTVQFGSGQAFPLAQSEPFGNGTVPTGKSFERISGRLFLIEKVDYLSIREHLAQLPPSASVDPNRKKGILEPGSPIMTSLLPPRPAGQPGTWRTDPYAKVDSGQKGFVIDYVAINSSMTNTVLKGDTTYLITNTVALYGTTVLEGAVVKFGTNAQLNIYGPLSCRTDRYRPATFLSKDDNRMGETISGSTGTPMGPCAVYTLALRDTSATYDIHDIRVFHSLYGVTLFQNVNADLSHLHVGKCHRGVGWALNNLITCRNFLFYDLTNAFYATVSASGTNRAEHGTIHRVDNFLSNPNSNRVVTLTNTLLISVTNNLVYSGTNDVVHSLGDTGFFQTVGGAHYLANNSTNRNAGTTNINPGLLVELKRRTTEPPQTLFNTNMSVNTSLSPIVQGDTATGDLPDLGYHYSILDFIASRVMVAPNVTVTATNGVSIAIDYSQTNWGFILNESKFFSQGSAAFPNQIVRAHMVQETGTGNPGSRAMFYDNAFGGATQVSEARFRFTELAQLSGDGYMFYLGTAFSALEWTHSSVHCPSLVIDIAGQGSLVCGLTNTLWEGGAVEFGTEDAGPGTTVHLRNNLFRGTTVHFMNGTTNWTARDNLFDSMGTNIYDNGSPVQNSYNAYYQSTNSNFSGGVSNLFLTNLVYEAGPLGEFYQVSTLRLIPILNH